MNSKSRQFLTLLFLLSFSVENLAAVAVSPDAAKFTTYHKIEAQKEALSANSFLSEVNEGNDDDKVHSLATSPQVLVPYSDYSFVSKIKRDFQRSFDSRYHQQVLQLICRLTI